MDRSEYTLSANATPVPVREFRNAIDALFRVCRVDFPACVGAKEQTNWVPRARLVASRLLAMDCKRARVEDWDRREVAIERATALVLRVSLELGLVAS